MNLKLGLGITCSIVCIFFGVVFALASAYAISRLIVAVILFIVGFAIIGILYALYSKPAELVQRIELSGQMKGSPIKCPSCGASISPSKIKILDGVPYAACDYCGKTVEVTEEPKW